MVKASDKYSKPTIYQTKKGENGLGLMFDVIQRFN